MNGDRWPVEHIAFGLMAALVLGLGAWTLKFKPDDPGQANAQVPQITLERPISRPYRSVHWAAAEGAFVDPFGPAAGVTGLRRPFDRVARTGPIRRATTPGRTQPPGMERVHIPLPQGATTPDPVETPSNDNATEDEPPPPEFAAAVKSVGQDRQGVWSVRVQPNSWTDSPLDFVRLRVGDRWHYDGGPYTILRIDFDGIRVKFPDGTEQDLPLGGAPAAANDDNDALPNSSVQPSSPRGGRPNPSGRNTPQAGSTGGSGRNGGRSGRNGHTGNNGNSSSSPRGQPPSIPQESLDKLKSDPAFQKYLDQLPKA